LQHYFKIDLLVASRLHFTLPGLHEKQLNVLPATKAEVLLLEICPRLDGQAATVATLCGRLPLAVRLAATLLKGRVDVDLDDYVGRLKAWKLTALPAAGADPSVEASIRLRLAFAGNAEVLANARCLSRYI
jgi:hypothetical protein